MNTTISNIPYFRPSIGPEETSAVVDVLSSGWLTTGRVVKEFEAKFAAFLGARHAVGVNSCTAALHLGLEALGVRAGDLVLVPTMTFAATAAVVRHLGARPVLVDCDPDTLCIDPRALENAAHELRNEGRLKAMIAMHYGGQMADMVRISRLSEELGIPVVEDAAHALPASFRESPDHPWMSVGATSPVTCFSFYANKCITTGEGGMIVTDDPRLAERVRKMSLHGLSKSAWNRYRSAGSWAYEIVEAGFKYNLTDLAAAIGVAQLNKADEFYHRRRLIGQSYADRLAGYGEFLDLPREAPNTRSSWHLYPIRLRLDRLSIDRAQFIRILSQKGITCSVHWMPLHLHPYYRNTYGYQASDLPMASAEWPRLISLPIFPDMTEEEVDYVCESIASAVEEHRRRSYSLGAKAVA